MTKMKNTKKGMAKKALSISLIAAMLATSNVPVWAAFEAEDPADVAVEAQADTFAEDEQVAVPNEEITSEGITFATANTDSKQLWVLDENNNILGTTTGTIKVKKSQLATIQLKDENDNIYDIGDDFTVAENPDTVNPDGTYNATITLTNGNTFDGGLTLTITVENDDENLDNGIFTIKTATGSTWDGQWGTVLITDMDTNYNLGDLTYQWQKRDASDSNAQWEAIDGANNIVYTPTEDLVKYGNGNDKDYLLRVYVGYTENGNTKYTVTDAVAVKPRKVSSDEIDVYFMRDGARTLVDIDNGVYPLSKAEVNSIEAEVDGETYTYANDNEQEITLLGYNPELTGEQQVSIQLNSPYDGVKQFTVNVNSVDISNATVTIASDKFDYTYDPEGITPVIEKVEVGGKLLEAGKDYVVETLHEAVSAPVSQSNINGGTVPVRIRGINKFSGEFVGTTPKTCINILPANIADANNVTVRLKDNVTTRPVNWKIGLEADNATKAYTDFFQVYYNFADKLVLAPDNNFTIVDEDPINAEGLKTTVLVQGTAVDYDGTTGTWNIGDNYYGAVPVSLTTAAEDAKNIFDDETKTADGTTRSAKLLAEIAKAIHGPVYMKTGSALNRVANDNTVASDTYTGSELTYPGLNSLSHVVGTVNGTDVTETLRINQDYTVEYKYNLNAGAHDDSAAPTVIITMKDGTQYKGSRTFTFDILKKAITDIGDGANQIHGAIQPIIFNPLATASTAKNLYDPLSKFGLTYMGKTLSPTKDYENVHAQWVADNSNAGGHFKYTFYAHRSTNDNDGQQYYDGNFNAAQITTAAEIDNVAITAKSLLSTDIVFADIPSQEWSGKAITPALTVTDQNGKYALVENKDYTVKWEDNVATGEATVTIEGIANRYTGKLQKHFNITSTSLEKGKIVKDWKPGTNLNTVYNTNDLTLLNELYDDGKAVAAEFVVVDANNNRLVENRDYTVAYENNTQVGTATITVTGMGSYSGTLTTTFKIVGKGFTGKFDVSIINDQVYTGEEIKPAVVFTPDEAKLVEGKDYEIAYVNNVKVYVADGKHSVADDNYPGPYVVARGIGNYAGQIRVPFNILKANLNASNITVTDAEYAGGQIAVPALTVKNPISGKELEEGKEYSVQYKGGINAGDKGEAIVTLKDTDNYTISGGNANTISVNYQVVAKDLKNVEIKAIEDQEITGEQIKPELVVMNGSVKMTAGVDYEVTYGENKEVGEGTALIKALDSNKNYVGEQEVKFNIVENPFKVAIPELTTGVNRNAVSASVKVIGGATGYDYVLCKSEADFAAQNYFKYNLNAEDTSSIFRFVREGEYFVYARAIKRDADGQKIYSDWSKPVVVSVTTDTPNAPTVTNVKVSGKNVTVTYTTGARTQGVDVMLGTATRIVDEELRPVTYGKNLVKNVPVKTKSVTFKNVAAGTYYVGVHPYINSSEGLKYFGRWSKQNDITAITVK